MEPECGIRVSGVKIMPRAFRVTLGTTAPNAPKQTDGRKGILFA
jgi:hypothetical protein